MDDYNHCLYSQIIKSLGMIPLEVKSNADDLTFESKGVPLFQGGGSASSLKSAMIRLLGACSRLIPDSLQDIVFYQSYIKPMDLIKLQLSMKMMPLPYRFQVDVVYPKIDWEMRRDIKLKQGENEFESILKECIPLHVPKIYVEGYFGMVQRAKEGFPKSPRVILTSNAYKVDERFKFW
ncbi:MAG TPA: hypothetical protein EYQ84_05870, partial [Nitrospinaceae bacterium]|nr:hypothetical protein [Nitrospinaceae bacterium]